MDPGHQNLDQLVTETIHRTTGRNFEDDSRLVELGIDSLAAVRMILTLIPEGDSEIDLSALVDLRTVGEFRRWIQQQMKAALDVEGKND